MKHIIILAGKKQTGKDIFSSFFIKDGYFILAFAKALKFQLFHFLCGLLNVASSKVDLNYNKESNLGITLSDGTEWTNRKALQWYGQVMKQQFGQNYWVDKVIDEIMTIEKNGGNKFVITDCRFIYEMEGIKNEFELDYKITTVYLKRNNGLFDDDISENSINENNYNFDFVIDNNGGIEDLEKQYQKIMWDVT